MGTGSVLGRRGRRKSVHHLETSDLLQELDQLKKRGKSKVEENEKKGDPQPTKPPTPSTSDQYEAALSLIWEEMEEEGRLERERVRAMEEEREKMKAMRKFARRNNVKKAPPIERQNPSPKHHNQTTRQKVIHPTKPLSQILEDSQLFAWKNRPTPSSSAHERFVRGMWIPSNQEQRDGIFLPPSHIPLL